MEFIVIFISAVLFGFVFDKEFRWRVVEEPMLQVFLIISLWAVAGVIIFPILVLFSGGGEISVGGVLFLYGVMMAIMIAVFWWTNKQVNS